MAVRVTAVTALAFAMPAAAAPAATLGPLKACYVSTGPATQERENVTVRGTSFVPNTKVEVLVDGVSVASAPTDAVGDFTVFVDAPHQPGGERRFTLEARDGVSAVSLQSRVSNLTVTVRPRRSAPSRRVRFRGRGFMEPRPVYAHYLYGGQLQKTVRLARRTTAPCGTFRVKRRQIPVDNPRTGRWTVQIDQKTAYAPEPDPVWVRLPIDVSEMFPAAQTAAGASTGTRLKTSSPSAASTSIRSPTANSPFNRPSASGSTSRLEITRLSGRAP
jgi:hypothetical protein